VWIAAELQDEYVRMRGSERERAGVAKIGKMGLHRIEGVRIESQVDELRDASKGSVVPMYVESCVGGCSVQGCQLSMFGQLYHDLSCPSTLVRVDRFPMVCR
jgi:hypothetical protein